MIYNGASLDERLMARVARGIASKYEQAGVKNVSYEVRPGTPNVATEVRYELFPTPHSHMLEIRKDKEGSPTIPADKGGQNWEFGGHSAVDTSAVRQRDPKSDYDLSTALTNVGTHESAHDVLQHQGGPNDMMNEAGEGDSKWLFDPDLELSPAEARALKNKYNSANETDETPPQLQPSPPPPHCSNPGAYQCY